MATITKGISVDDRKDVEKILRSTDFFYEFEVQITLGIFDETIEKGEEGSGYYWMKITDNNGLVAFANYGKNPSSVHSWDLYWLAVDNNSRNKKLGSALIKAVEDDVRKQGGKILWIETAGRPLYAPTESFYRSKGYTLAASLKDFYSMGDPKQIYSKVL